MALRAAVRGISPVTVNRDVAELRSALGKAVQWGFLDVHPLARMKPVKTHAGPIVRWLSDDEEMRLRAALEFREERLRSARVRAKSYRKEFGDPPTSNLRQVDLARFQRTSGF